MPPNHFPIRVLILGNFLSGSGRSRGVCEDLADRLEAAGFTVYRASHHPGRLKRLLHMTTTVLRLRGRIDVAQVDGFSGPAFALAEMVCAALRLTSTPYFAAAHPGAFADCSAARPL